MIDLRVFFGSGNAIRYSANENASDGQSDRLKPFLKHVSASAPVVALPRGTIDQSGGKCVHWYVFYRESEMERPLIEILRSFIGASYGDFTKRLSRLDISDSFDAALSNGMGRERSGLVFVFGVTTQHYDAVRERLLTMLELVNSRPIRRTTPFRPVGRILRDYEFALSQGTYGLANECLSELRDSRLLDPKNMAYLEIRHLAAAGLFNSLLTRADLRTVLDIGTPPLVSESIAIAVFEDRLRERLEREPLEDCLQFVKEEILPTFSGVLLGSPLREAADERALLSYLAARVAAARGFGSPTNWLSQIRSASKRTLAEKLIAHTANSRRLQVETNSMELARIALSRLDIDGAMRELSQCPPGVEKTRLLVSCALMSPSPAVSNQVWSAFDAMSEDDRQSFLGQGGWKQRFERATVLLECPQIDTDSSGTVVSASHSVEDCATRQRIDGWGKWFRRLASHQPWQGAIATMQELHHEWSLAELKQEDSLASVIDVVNSDLHGWALDALHQALPVLVSVLADESSLPSSDWTVPLLKCFFELLYVDERRSVPALTAMFQIHSVLAKAGIPPAEYIQNMTLIREVSQDCESPAVVPVLLDAVEELFELPCPSVEERDNFVYFTQAVVLRSLSANIE